MKILFLYIFETSFTFSIIITFLSFVVFLIGKKFTAKCRYILWLIVVFSIAIPFGAISNISLVTLPIQIFEENTVKSETLISNANMDTISNPIPISDKIDQSPEIQVLNMADSSTIPRDTTPTAKAIKINLSVMLYYVSLIWVFGVIMCFAWNTVVFLRYTQKIKKQLQPADELLLEIFSLICSQYKIHRKPKLFISNSIDSPILFGFCSSTVVIPNNLNSKDAVSSILAHELTHYKRRDLWAKMLILIVESLHWFNPFVHIAASNCNKEMELSCDECVLRNCSDEARVFYGNMMLDIVKRCRSEKTSLTTQFNPKPNAIKERFMNILDSTKKRSGKIFVLLVLILCIPANLLIACNDVSKTDNPTESKLGVEINNNNLVTTANEGKNTANEDITSASVVSVAVVASVSNGVEKDSLIKDGTVKTLYYQEQNNHPSYPKDGIFPDNELADKVESSVQLYWDLIFKEVFGEDLKSQYEIVPSDKGGIRFYYPLYSGKTPNNDAVVSIFADNFTDSCIQDNLFKFRYKIMQDGRIGISEGARGTNMTYVYKEYEIVTKTQDTIEANIVSWYFGENDKDLGQVDNYRNLKKDVPVHSKSMPLILKKENGKWKIDQITIWD